MKPTSSGVAYDDLEAEFWRKNNDHFHNSTPPLLPCPTRLCLTRGNVYTLASCDIIWCTFSRQHWKRLRHEFAQSGQTFSGACLSLHQILYASYSSTSQMVTSSCSHFLLSSLELFLDRPLHALRSRLMSTL